MLALIDQNDTCLGTYAEGAWVHINTEEHQLAVTAQDGWNFDVYSLKTILDADPVPPGKYATSSVIVVTDGVPKFIDTLADIPLVTPYKISRRQFFTGLWKRGFITAAEALAILKTGEVPAVLQAIIDVMTDEEARTDAELLVVGASEFYRDNPLVSVIAVIRNMTESDVDELWRFCDTL